MRSSLIAIVLLMVPATGAAQRGSPLQEITTGSRVRIWSDSTTPLMKARVLSPDPSGLTLQVMHGDMPQMLRLSDLDRIDLSRGKNRLGWTAMGVLAGAAAGVVITRLDDNEGDVTGLDGLANGFANTISGMLVGGIVGFFVAPERWRTIWNR